ncbi:MAG: hypothetical protein ACFHX7_07545 [Pseudomonadota bacterium]
MSRFVRPSPCSSTGELTDAQTSQWREEGFTFVRGLFPHSLVDAMAEAGKQAFPGPHDEAAKKFTDFGSNVVFPSAIAAFNEITLHPHLLQAVATLLQVPVTDLRLTQADLWPKYFREHTAPDTAGSEQDNTDQRIHVDYPNHTITHPTPWSRPEAVEMILYLSDAQETGGGTAVVARQGPDDPAYPWPIVDSPGIGELQYVNDRTAAENYFATEKPDRAAFRQMLYKREACTVFEPGDLLLYRHDTWHRGTPMKPGALRLVMNITYRKAASEWISTLHTGWAWSLYEQDKRLPRLLSEASLDQRAVLGFPQPGSSYWCPETILAIKARYGPFGFDTSPYEPALAEP